MNRILKFRMWNFVKDDPRKSKMFYDSDEVMACLSQQIIFDGVFLKKGYDHISDGNSFMQLTGLIDKNGKEIYEGDILDAGDRIVKVVWHEQAGQWDTDFIRYKGHRSSNGLLNSDWKYRAVVIGNIFETPFLLNQD